jgi:hypothetical protein
MNTQSCLDLAEVLVKLAAKIGQSPIVGRLKDYFLRFS